MSLHMINCSPGFFKYCGTHTHDCFELILNLEGEGIMTIGDQQFPFYPGSVHIVPKNTPHIKDSCNQFKDIYFLTDTLSMAMHSIDESRPIIFSDDADKTLEKLMHMMLYRYLQGNKNDSVLESMYELAISNIYIAITHCNLSKIFFDFFNGSSKLSDCAGQGGFGGLTEQYLFEKRTRKNKRECITAKIRVSPKETP